VSAATGAVVAIGGGHGLAASLAALRTLTDDLVAVVSVADDGGSSGRLRQSSELPAPGDLRKALSALSDPGSMLAAALNHRFEGGDLDGHAFGNLLIAALAHVGGDLVAGLDEVLRLTGGSGRVLPSTVDGVVLMATTEDGTEVAGQVQVMGTPRIDRVWLDPPDPDVPKEVLSAIDRADLLVLGPGSLFTSVLAAIGPPAVRDAVAAASAPLVYVCNLHPQAGESEGMGVAEHVAALGRHGLSPDVVLYDPDHIHGADGVPGAVAATLARPHGAAHDPALLADALATLDLPR
jgi:uncharacterized cofD-like protein